MQKQPNTFDLLNFRVPAVRHLAWMCHAPQLISSPLRFNPSQYVAEAQVWERLKTWDANPASGPDFLKKPPPSRLGQYFERLYECLMQDLLGWDVLLKNQPVRSNGLTLGELDFIVRNPSDGLVEHHEIAVKFYLGYQHTNREPALWYGPNSRDRLDLKTNSLIARQSRLTEKPETRALLDSRGIPVPSRSRIFMPGYLFYPAGYKLQPPSGVPSDHLRGQWEYLEQTDARRSVQGQHDQAAEILVPLQKPHWLGPWNQQAPNEQETEDALATVRDQGIPRLFAVLEKLSGENRWHETSRLFVVPQTWPTH